MKKANITLQTRDNNVSYEVNITEKNSKLNYIEVDTNTNVFFDKNEKVLIRDNKDMYIELNFNTGMAIIYVKEFKKSFEYKMMIKSLDIGETKIKVEYIIDDENYIYTIKEMEV